MSSLFWKPAAICFGMNYFVWAVHGAPRKSDLLYDITGAASYLATALLSYRGALSSTMQGNIVTAGGMVWALRLGSFLLRRILRDGTDRRQKLKTKPIAFLIPWTLQAIWTLSLLTPTILANAYAQKEGEDDRALSKLQIGAAITWMLSFSLEIMADQQKHKFAEKGLRETKGFIQSGLWSVSRHPNYLGEITLWLSSAIFSYESIKRNEECAYPQLAFAAPVVSYLLLCYVSGIPLLEKRAAKKWGKSKEFQAYVKSTPLLFANPLALFRELARALLGGSIQ
eukprot:g5170.t1